MSRTLIRSVANGSEVVLECEGEHSTKLLARATVEGIHFFCRGCRDERRVTWADLEQVKAFLRGHAGACLEEPAALHVALSVYRR